MKVTFLTLEYPPNVYGGAGVHVANLTRALSKKIDVEVRCQGTPSCMRGGEGVLRYEMPDSWNRAVSALLMDTAMLEPAIDADIVHCHTWYTDLAGLWAKRLYDTGLVATIHSLEPLRPWKEEQLGTGYQLSKWMERSGLEGCDRLIAVSREMKGDILDCYDIDPERIDIVPNGIDPKRYYPRENRAILDDLGVGERYVLFVGRISRQKGILDLLDAFEAIHGCQLVLVTGKADTPELKEEVAGRISRMDDVLWLDRFLGEEEACQLYTHASVFACPSRYEPFGIINLEAMACGTAVVASRVGGIKEVVVDGETGCLVEPGDAGALAERIQSLLDDPKLAARMGEAGRTRVRERYTWERVAEMTIGVYEKVLGR